MTASLLLRQLEPLKGKQLIDCEDEIEAIAKKQRFSVNVTGGEFPVASIDRNFARLNVVIDTNSVITGFTTG